MQEMQKVWVQSLGQKSLLEKEMAIHSSILAWKIPSSGERSGAQFLRAQRVGQDWVTKHKTTTQPGITNKWMKQTL